MLYLFNVMGNTIGKDQLAKLQEIMHSKPNLVSLCGIADDATEADLSGLGMDADDAAVLSLTCARLKTAPSQTTILEWH